MLDPFHRSCGPRVRKSCKALPKRYVAKSYDYQFHMRIIPNRPNPQTSANGNITTSDIVYLPTPEDNGKVIACSVPVEEKNNAPTLSIKDTRILDVKRKHHLSLSVHWNQLRRHLSPIRCSHRDAVARLKFGPEKSGQRHRRLLGMSHRIKSANQEDWMVS